MDNLESVLEELEKFEKNQSDAVPPVLEDFIRHVSKTGDVVFPWPRIKFLIRSKLSLVMNDFYENRGGDDFSECPNVPPFTYAPTRDKLLEHFDSFAGAPFTMQRLCEIMMNPSKHYKRTDKLLRGLEKNILVVSSVEPRQKRLSSSEECNDQPSSWVNGLQDSSGIGSSGTTTGGSPSRFRNSNPNSPSNSASTSNKHQDVDCKPTSSKKLNDNYEEREIGAAVCEDQQVASGSGEGRAKSNGHNSEAAHVESGQTATESLSPHKEEPARKKAKLEEDEDPLPQTSSSMDTDRTARPNGIKDHPDQIEDDSTGNTSPPKKSTKTNFIECDQNSSTTNTTTTTMAKASSATTTSSNVGGSDANLLTQKEETEAMETGEAEAADTSQRSSQGSEAAVGKSSSNSESGGSSSSMQEVGTSQGAGSSPAKGKGRAKGKGKQQQKKQQQQPQQPLKEEKEAAPTTEVASSDSIQQQPADQTSSSSSAKGEGSVADQTSSNSSDSPSDIAEGSKESSVGSPDSAQDCKDVKLKDQENLNKQGGREAEATSASDDSSSSSSSSNSNNSSNSSSSSSPSSSISSSSNKFEKTANIGEDKTSTKSDEVDSTSSSASTKKSPIKKKTSNSGGPPSSSTSSQPSTGPPSSSTSSQSTTSSQPSTSSDTSTHTPQNKTPTTTNDTDKKTDAIEAVESSSSTSNSSTEGIEKSSESGGDTEGNEVEGKEKEASSAVSCSTSEGKDGKTEAEPKPTVDDKKAADDTAQPMEED